jgi:hypothetical protein
MLGVWAQKSDKMRVTHGERMNAETFVSMATVERGAA